MKKNQDNIKIIPTYTAPKEILESIELEENNEVVNDLNKKISDIESKKKISSKYKRDISPERVDPLRSLSKQNNTQNLKQRSYKEIMLEQKKMEEREKNLRNKISALDNEEKSKQYNNINYNSRSLNLNPKPRKEDIEINSIYTKETKWKTNINDYEKRKNEEFLMHKRKKEDGNKYEKSYNDDNDEGKIDKNNEKIENKEKDDDISKSSEIVEEKEEL